ncbi:MAG: BatD family protein [Pseudomonadota bacterium]|nr:BatD family protein [Pseudomonadota bacterium]
MVSLFSLVSVVLLLYAGTSLAGSFSAFVDKTEGTLADQFILTVEVDGKADSKPQLPVLNDFSATPAGTSHSTAWINGEFSSKVSYRYILTPERIGKLQIPSMSLVVDGKQIDTLPITITIKKELNTPPTITPAVFLEREFASDRVYVGQQVLETIRLHYRVDVRDVQLEDRQLIDFSAINLGKERHYRRAVNGVNYNVIELKNALIPLKAHDTHVPRYGLQVQIPSTTRHRNPFDDMWGDFFSTTNFVRKRLISKEFNLQVLPLPAPPTDSIDLAVVGEFNIEATINKRRLTVGESATLTLAVSGKGNLQGMQPLTFEFTDAKVYPDKPEIKMQKNWDTGLTSTAVFTFAILPDHEGELNLGEHTFAFFNPETGKHETATLDLGVIAVSAGKSEQRVVVGGRKDNMPAVATIKDIHRGQRLTVNHSLTAALRLRLLAIAGLLLVVCGGLYLYQRCTTRRVRINAYRDFKRCQIKDIVALDRAIRAYLCSKYGVRMSATRQEINSSLQTHGLEIKLQEQLDKFLQQLELILYASQNGANATKIITAGRALVEELES